MKKFFVCATALLSIAACTFYEKEPEQAEVILYQTTTEGNGQGLPIGTVSLNNTPIGLKVHVIAHDIEPGTHGFHVHQNPDCAPLQKGDFIERAGAAGGHYDPKETGKHAGPMGKGHQGDLTPLIANASGRVDATFYVKNVTVSDFKGRSLIVHEGGDNFSDTPLPLGGGGARFACGIIQ